MFVVMMASKVLYGNSNEICSLIESTCGWSVTPLGCLDDPEGPGELLLFDPLFYQLPEGEWTVREVLEKRPEWERQILPLLKARRYAYLFKNEWHVKSYVKELDKVLFRSTLTPPMALKDRDWLLSTECLTFMMRQEFKSLMEPAIYACFASERLSAKLKRPVDLSTPSEFRDVCKKLEDLVLQLDLEVSDWKDRFFFDALDAHENDLCSD